MIFDYSPALGPVRSRARLAPTRSVYPPRRGITLPAEGGTANSDADLTRGAGLVKKAAIASGSCHASIPLDAQERRVDQRQMRALRHAACVRYFDFTPVMIVALASVVGARYLAIGTGDTELYIFAGMRAAVVISVPGVSVPGGGEGE